MLATGTLSCNTNNVQLKTILLPLKTKDDGTIPMRKKEIIVSYIRCTDCAPPIFAIVEREEVYANAVDWMGNELEANEVDHMCNEPDYEELILQSCDM